MCCYSLMHHWKCTAVCFCLCAVCCEWLNYVLCCKCCRKEVKKQCKVCEYEINQGLRRTDHKKHPKLDRVKARGDGGKVRWLGMDWDAESERGDASTQEEKDRKDIERYLKKNEEDEERIREGGSPIGLSPESEKIDLEADIAMERYKKRDEKPFGAKSRRGQMGQRPPCVGHIEVKPIRQPKTTMEMENENSKGAAVQPKVADRMRTVRAAKLRSLHENGPGSK